MIEISNRLMNVQIDNKYFRNVISAFDFPDTLFYCDPPYLQARPGYIPGSFSMKDHEDLAKLLNNVKGKVCLSYYPHPKVDELYPDWRRDQKEVAAFSALTQGGKKKPKRIEPLLTNY